jgi:MFS family permease
MAPRREITTVYAAGLIQGVALVTFPATSAIFTNRGDYGLSNSEYGGLFVPQAVLAIVASLLEAGLSKRLGTKRIFLFGLFANLLAMTLLVVSRFAMREHSMAYAILLAATACLGIGFGFTVPALNTLAAAFFPQKVDKAVLGLNALLGLGTALAPVLVALFVGLGIWWGLPVVVGTLMVGLLLFSFNLSLSARVTTRDTHMAKGKSQFPARFWIFAAFALLYGVCETMNGNWAVPYMTKHFGANASIASLALAIFWGMVTAGRMLFAVTKKWFPEPMVCRVIPFLVAAALIASACAPKTSAFLGILTFALAGLGCSALLPLTISFAQKQLTTISASVAGGLIAFYQLGYGIAAFGVGPLQTWAGLNLSLIFGGTAIVALAMAALAFVVTQKASSPKGQPWHPPIHVS